MARIHIAAFRRANTRIIVLLTHVYAKHTPSPMCMSDADAVDGAMETAARPTDRPNGRKSEKRLHNNGHNWEEEDNEKVASVPQFQSSQRLPNEPKMTHRVEQTTTNRRRRTLVLVLSRTHENSLDGRTVCKAAWLNIYSGWTRYGLPDNVWMGVVGIRRTKWSYAANINALFIGGTRNARHTAGGPITPFGRAVNYTFRFAGILLFYRKRLSKYVELGDL